MPDAEIDIERVKRDLEKARAAWCSGIGRRGRVYHYLQTVFEIAEAWKREGKGIRFQELMIKMTNFSMGRRDRGRFRTLIFCSSEPKNPSDFRVRNKWVQWLELAAKEIKSGETIEEFVKERGRISDAPMRI